MCIISFVAVFGLKEYARKEAATDIGIEPVPVGVGSIE